jgi:flagellar motor component MotA
MFAIIGILLVFGAVIGGFLMEKGHLAVLVQPAEFLIIVGAALGTLLIANPLHTLKSIFGGVLSVFGKSGYSKQRYVSTLKMMFELLNKSRRARACCRLRWISKSRRKARSSNHIRILLPIITFAALFATQCAWP